jgi:chromosome segregation ATPase
MKESYSDFSIVKAYLELRQKYDSDIKRIKEGVQESEEQARQRIAELEDDVAKRNEYIKAQDAKLQELTQKLNEQTEQLKTMGLQLHKLKRQAPQQDEDPGLPEPSGRRRSRS